MVIVHSIDRMNVEVNNDRSKSSFLVREVTLVSFMEVILTAEGLTPGR